MSDLTNNNKQVVLILNMVPTICYGDRSKVITIIILKIKKNKAELGDWKQNAIIENSFSKQICQNNQNLLLRRRKKHIPKVNSKSPLLDIRNKIWAI